MMKKLILSITCMLLMLHLNAQNKDLTLKFENPVQVLNLGTFHMGYTPDANTTEFDEHDQKNIEAVHRIAREIAAFDPTVIVVETPPANNKDLQRLYQEYLNDPNMKFDNPSEIELLAFEVGRMAATNRIYGIDFQERYNYRIAYETKNNVDSTTYFRYMEMMQDLQKKFPEEEMSVLEKLQMTNHPDYQDFLININADMLTHVSTQGNAEGAHEASKFYHRNLVMYSNLNQIKLTADDRVFILMGGTHTAFFNIWLKRSPKYELVDVNEFLK